MAACVLAPCRTTGGYAPLRGFLRLPCVPGAFLFPLRPPGFFFCFGFLALFAWPAPPVRLLFFFPFFFFFSFLCLWSAQYSEISA